MELIAGAERGRLHQDDLRHDDLQPRPAFRLQSQPAPAVFEGDDDCEHLISCARPRADHSWQPEEQTISEYLLRIFTSCVADMPKASGSKFGESLQAVLLPLLNKPNLGNGGVVSTCPRVRWGASIDAAGQTLQELVACFCAAIKHQTHDFKRLANVFKACESRVRSDVTKLRRGAKLSEINVKSFPIVMFLVSSLVEHGDLETVRKHRGELPPPPKELTADSGGDRRGGGHRLDQQSRSCPVLGRVMALTVGTGSDS